MLINLVFSEDRTLEIYLMILLAHSFELTIQEVTDRLELHSESG